MKMIERQHYPQLDLLLWDIHDQQIEPEFAFQIYEQRWAFVDEANLTRNEQRLIESLTRTFANGHFLPMGV
ncbi:MAG: hypothetical protein R3F02_04265 [Thiolinea sp.]